MPLAVLAYVLAPEARRLDEIHLDRGELPLPPEHVLGHKVSLGPVERRLSRRRPVGYAGRVQSLREGPLRAGPLLVVCYVLAGLLVAQ